MFSHRKTEVGHAKTANAYDSQKDFHFIVWGKGTKIRVLTFELEICLNDLKLYIITLM